MKKSKKAAIIAICVIGVIAIIIAAVLGTYLPNRIRRMTGRTYERYTVTRGNLSSTAVGSGRISSADVKNVIPQGSVTELKVKSGDYVEVGTPLAEYVDADGDKKDFASEYEGVITAVTGGAFDTATGRTSAATFTISSVQSLQMEIQATEKNIYKIHPGQDASIYIDALNLTVDGVVSRVSMVGRTAGDFSVYDVTVSFDKNDNNIFLGMTGSARISIDNRVDVIKVPVDAIIERDNTRYVLRSEWLDNMNKPHRDYYIEVKTGLSDANYVEIAEGDIDGLEILIASGNNTMVIPDRRLFGR